MNLELLNDGIAGEKPWLNPVCNTLSCLNVFATGGTFGTITAGNIVGPVSTATVTLNNQSVPPSAPASGQVVLYTNSVGGLEIENSSALSVPYVSIPSGIGSIGHIPVFSAVGGAKISDSGLSKASWVYQQFSQFSQVTVFNTVATTSILTAGDDVGSTTISFPQPVGSSIKIKILYEEVGSGVATYSIAPYIDGAIQGPITVTSTVGSTDGVFTVDMNVGADFINILSVNQLSGASPVMLNLRPAYDPTVAHTFDVRVTWSAAASGNNFGCLQAQITTVGF